MFVSALCVVFLGKNQLTTLLIQLKPRKYSGLSERLQKSDVIDSIDLEKLSLFDAIYADDLSLTGVISIRNGFNSKR